MLFLRRQSIFNCSVVPCLLPAEKDHADDRESRMHKYGMASVAPGTGIDLEFETEGQCHLISC